MILPLSDIWLADESRLRQQSNYGDIEDLAARIEELGLLQDILVIPTPADETEAAGNRPWKIVDGGRRFTAISKLAVEKRAIPDLEPGHISAKIKEADLDEYGQLIREYHANADRVDFTWQEQCDYVRRVHNIQRTKLGKVWTVESTAAILRMSPESVYKHLAMSADPEIYNSPEVKGSKSFVTAHKKSSILKNRKKREVAASAHTTSGNGDQPAETRKTDEHDTRLDITARTLYAHADAREWILRNPDETFDFIHWDPPYGGGQDGGPNPLHERIDDSEASSFNFQMEMLPELYRTLKDGHWMAIWFYPPFAERVRQMLQGHDFTATTDCIWCKRTRRAVHISDPCPKAKWGFWVNPHPNIWFKQNRNSDGHEIKRFLTNQVEMFYLAAKWDKAEPTLIDSSRSNVFAFDTLISSVRRHVMHKPPALLADIFRLISVPGELGCDPSAGSGSSIEAAVESGRRLVACEISETIWLDSIGHIKEKLRIHGISSLKDMKKPEAVEATV